MTEASKIRAVLAEAYDLAPSIEKAEATRDIHARMARVVPFADWAFHAPYAVSYTHLTLPTKA